MLRAFDLIELQADEGTPICRWMILHWLRVELTLLFEWVIKSAVLNLLIFFQERWSNFDSEPYAHTAKIKIAKRPLKMGRFKPQ